MKLTEPEICSYCGYLLPNHEDKCKLMSKLTEERIAAILGRLNVGKRSNTGNENIPFVSGIESAASAIYSAHQEEVKEMEEWKEAAAKESLRMSDNIQAYLDKYKVGRVGEWIDDCLIKDAERLREENALLKQRIGLLENNK